MNDKNLDGSKDTTPEAGGQDAPAGANKGALDAARETARKAAETIKSHDFKGDARKAADEVKNLKESLGKHNFKTELREAFAEAKANPASIWKKPDAPRPGKELAIVGLAASIVLFLVLAITSSSFLGFLCLLLAVGGLLFSLLGLKTEGRKIAIGGTAVGLLVVICSLGQMFSSSGGGDGGEGEEGGVVASPAKSRKGDGKYPVPVANEGRESSSVDKILEEAENAKRNNSLNFYGFYTGMSFKDAKLLREHYGLNKDHLWFYFNKENGEVYKMWFTPKAITSIMDVANNLSTIELALQEYLGIVEWNNEKQVIEGEVDSIFQDEGDKFWFGDKADVVRMYRTADGVVVRLYPNQKAWNSGKGVLQINDTQRGKKAIAFNLPFDNKLKMREELAALKEKGIKTVMLQLPNGFEWLMRDFKGSWVSAFPMADELRKRIFYGREDLDTEQWEKENDLRQNGVMPIVQNFNDLPPNVKNGVQFRMPFPEEEKEIKDAAKSKANGSYIIGEGEAAAKANASRLSQLEVGKIQREADLAWRKMAYEADRMRQLGKSGDEIKDKGLGMKEEEFKEDFLLRKGIRAKDGNYYRLDESELKQLNEERDKRQAEEKAKAEEARKAREKQEAERKAAEEKARRDKAEIERARKEKSEVEKLVQPQGSNNQGQMSLAQLEASIPGAPAGGGNLLERGQSQLKEMDARLSKIEKSIAEKRAEIAKLQADAKDAKEKAAAFHANGQTNEENQQNGIANLLESKAKSNDDALQFYLRGLSSPSSQLNIESAGIKDCYAKATEFAAELEKREKADRETAQQLRGTAPEEAINDWLSAAEMLKNAGLQHRDLAEKCAKMFDRVNALTSKGK